jgi:thioesterase domain-containing protein
MWFHKQARGIPRVFIPATGHSCESHFPLLKQLPDDAPVCMLENLEMLQGMTLPLDEIRDYYLAALFRQRRVEEYYLAGWSRGALIAHAMALAMIAAGVKVRALILIDPVVLLLPAHAIASIEKELQAATLTRFERRIVDAQLSIARTYQYLPESQLRCVLFKAGAVDLAWRAPNESTLAYRAIAECVNANAMVIDGSSRPGYERYLKNCSIVRLTGSHFEALSSDNGSIIAAAMAKS